MHIDGPRAERGRSEATFKGLVFSAVFLFSLGASAQAAVSVPMVDPVSFRLGVTLAIAAAAAGWFAIARHRWVARRCARSIR